MANLFLQSPAHQSEKWKDPRGQNALKDEADSKSAVNKLGPTGVRDGTSRWMNSLLFTPRDGSATRS